MICRYKCTNPDCSVIHRQLTEEMIAYKQYASEVIEDVVDDLVTKDDSIDLPCSGTIKQWKYWYLCISSRIDSALRKFVPSTALDIIREQMTHGWLGKAFSLFLNSTVDSACIV